MYLTDVVGEAHAPNLHNTFFAIPSLHCRTYHYLNKFSQRLCVHRSEIIAEHDASENVHLKAPRLL